ncbi:MAG: phosphate ABC transporter substrate-binding protein PstS [Rhodoluna sp.]|nr:phosphate ABC transporter substrate-binding protein PstS [Rhodoluna sp.]
MKKLLRRITSALVLVSVSLGALSLPAMAQTYFPITGSGSTWSQNALDQWRRNVYSNYGITVNYTGVGSSAGRRDFIAKTVDFAVSEIPFQTHPEDGSAPEVPTTKYAYMPIVAGGTSFMYNLKVAGKRVTNLRLSGEVVTKIFTGVITNWSDPAIAKDNPGLKLPNKIITPVVRSDGSGTTAQFSLWMSKQHPAIWNDFCKKVGRATPCGLTSQFPNYSGFKSQSGSNGVAGYVSQDYGEGAITYVEYSYALKSGFPVVKVLNKAGFYVEPTAQSVAVALLQAKINEDTKSPDYLTQILTGVYNATDPRAYPISSYSYMIVPTEVAGTFSLQKGKTLGAFAHYMLCEGQQQAGALGYSPLPLNLVQAGFKQISRIPGASDAANVDISKCNNPTFKPGDKPGNNLLAKTAPMPQACDKQGAMQCDGGSSSSTGGSGSGGTGTSTGGDGAGTGTDTGSGGSTYVGPTGNGKANLEAYAYTPPKVGWGANQTWMVIAGLLAILLVLLPPFAIGWIEKRKSRGN